MLVLCQQHNTSNLQKKKSVILVIIQMHFLQQMFHQHKSAQF